MIFLTTVKRGKGREAKGPTTYLIHNIGHLYLDGPTIKRLVWKSNVGEEGEGVDLPLYPLDHI